METKPYSIQSPEIIARDYGGNKQRIVQAAQMGLLDPTAAVLAGMFIDRMRGAQAVEQAPQQTVAQQVLSAPPTAPTSAGLGATPEAMQLAQAYPAEGAPPPIPGPSMSQQPVMAAEGGLMSLPVDGDMFPDGYAEGGIVAFADGGMSEDGLTREQEARRKQVEEDRRRLARAGLRAAEFVASPMAAATNVLTENVVNPLINAAGIPRAGRALGVFSPDTDKISISQVGPFSRLRTAFAEPETPTTSPQPAKAGTSATGAQPPIGTPPAKEVTAAPTVGATAPSVSTKTPAVPKFTTNTDSILTEYLKGSEEREGRLQEAISANRLQGKPFEEYAAQLRKEAEQAGAEKEDAKNMALVKAGLAIMGGTSPYALQNIGKGAMVGVEDYQAAMKDLKRAERERTKEFANIEQARRAEERGDLERRDAALVRASEAADRRQGLVTDARVKVGMQEQQQQFDAWRTQAQIAAQRDIANAQLAGRMSGRGGVAGGLTQRDMLKLSEDAMAAISKDDIRAQLAKAKKITAPPEGSNSASAIRFNNEVEQQYKKAINAYIQQRLSVLYPQAEQNPNAGWNVEGVVR